MIRTLLVLLLLTSLSAMADEHRHDGNYTSSSQKQTQDQGQHQSQSSDSHNTVQNSNTYSPVNSTASSSNSGASNGDQSVVSNYPRQTPPAYAPDVFPTAPCMTGLSGGLGLPPIGISMGGSKADKDCQLMELGRMFAMSGNKQAAAKAWCHTKAAKRAGLTEADCNAFAQPVVNKPEPVPAPVLEISVPVVMIRPPMLLQLIAIEIVQPRPAPHKKVVPHKKKTDCKKVVVKN